jgi:hypothetical protein
VLPYLHDEDEDEEPVQRGRPGVRIATASADGGGGGGGADAAAAPGEDWNDDSFVSDYGEVIRRTGGTRGFELDESEVIVEEVEDKLDVDSDSDSSIDLHTPLP